MARIFLDSDETDVLGRTPNTIIGTNDAETVNLSANAQATFDASFNRGGDTIFIDGDSDLYNANLVGGSNLRLTSSNGANILIPIGAGINIVFSDGIEQDLGFNDDGSVTLGETDIPLDGSTVTIGDGTGSTGETTNLIVGQDDVTGTGGDDLFRARVVQNQLGAQTNTLGSGDMIDGGAGRDTLIANIQDASPLNAGPTGSIAPETVSVEVAYFNADANYADAEDGNEFDFDYEVEVNAEDMWGLEDIGSLQSDASLKVYNVTTLTNSGDYDDRRATESITVTMDHTGNGNAVLPAADMTVLFDQDYLIANPPAAQNSSLTLQLLDIDNQIINNQPLLTNPFDTLRFSVDGEIFTLAFDGRSELSGAAAYQEIADSINNSLANAGLGDLNAVVTSEFTVVDPDATPGGPADGFNIVITNSGSGVLAAVGFIASGVIPPNTDYQKEVFPTPPEQINELITVDIVLEKVGRVSDADDIDLGIGGGALTVGGMATNYANVLGQGGQGIEQFDITVRGDSTEPSSLASLQSTNNSLEEVYVQSQAGSEADLVIGNVETFEVANGAFQTAYGTGGEANVFDVTTVRNNALKDVLIFDSTGNNDQGVGAFVNDITLHAYFSDEVLEKYLDVTDSQPDAGDDDQDAIYTLGAGDDTLNVNISQSNFVSLGSATRDDFSFTAFTGAGDDLVQIQLGDGFNADGDIGRPGDPVVDAWYQNHVLSENLTIVTGDGDDKVETWGASAADIVLGAGDDVAITDDSGTVEFFDPEFADEDAIQSAYNATWVFNTEADGSSILDPISQSAAAITNVANLTLTVSFQGIEKTVNVGTTVGAANGATVTDLTINQAIKDAVNNDPILSELLVAEDGPGRTLFVRSIVDGQNEVTDFTVNLGVSGPLTGAQLAVGSPATLLGGLSAAQLGLLGLTVTGTGAGAVGTFTGDRYDPEFATLVGGVMDGNDSFQVNNDQVEGGAGNDLIVLSSSFGSVETIDINGAFDNDTILNFTATIAGEATPEVQTFTFTGDSEGEGTFTLSALGFTTEEIAFDDDDSDTPAGDLSPTTEEELAQAAFDALTAAVGGAGTVVLDGSTVTVTSNNDGANEENASVVQAGGEEVQNIEFFGADTDVVAGDTFTVFFGGVGAPGGVSYTVTADDVASADPIIDRIAQGLADSFNDVAAGSAVAAGPILELTNVTSGNVPSAAVVTSSDIDYVVTTEVEGTSPGFTIAATSIDGIEPSIGYDIFDVETVLNGAVTFVDNDQQVDGAEAVSIAGIVAGVRGVAIIDTVEADDYAFDASSTTALARIQEIAREADTGTQAAAQNGLVITVNADNVGTFYLVSDGTAAGDATVTQLGSVELGQYDLAGKEAIGNWDAMSIVNFDPLTTAELIQTFDAQAFNTPI